MSTDYRIVDMSQQGEEPGAMLTVAQVAQILNAHPHSVRRWADMGLLPVYRIGVRGDRRFKSQDVEDFLRGRKLNQK